MDCIDSVATRKIMEEALGIQIRDFLWRDLKIDTFTMSDELQGKINLFVADKLLPEIFGQKPVNELLSVKQAVMTLKDYAKRAHWAHKHELEKAIETVKLIVDDNENALKNERGDDIESRSK